MSSALSPWLVLLAVIAGCAVLAVAWWRRQGGDAQRCAQNQDALDLDLAALQPPTEWQTLAPRSDRAAWPDTVPAARPSVFIEPMDALPGDAWAKRAPPAAAPRRRPSSAMPPFAPTGSPGL